MDANVNLLDQLIDSVSRCFTGDGARRLLEIRASDEVQQRLDELADKNTEGNLSPAERAEYEVYVSAANVIALLKVKTRDRLANNPTAL